MTRLVAIICLFAFQVSVKSQDVSKVDSLINTLKSQSADTTKIQSLHLLYKLHRKVDVVKSREFANQALELAVNSDLSFEKARSYDNIGRSYYDEGSLDIALEYYNKALVIKEDLNHNRGIAATLNRIGLVYWRKGDYDQAVDAYQGSLNLYNQLGNTQLTAMTTNNIGLVYWKMGRLDKALEYYRQSLSIQRDRNAPLKVAQSLNNIAIIYAERKLLDTALVYFKESLALKERYGKPIQTTAARSNLGEIYLEVGEYVNAIEQYTRALTIQRDYGDSTGMMFSLFGVGGVYVKKGDELVGIQYLEEGLAIGKKLGMKEAISNGYLALAKAYEQIRAFNKAYNFLKLHGEMKDSVFTDKSAQQLAKMEALFETEKKDKELKIASAELHKKQAEVEKQGVIIISALATLGLLSLLVFFVLRSYREKNRANKLLEQQHHEIKAQKAVIEANNKNMIDSINYARRIQESSLPLKTQLAEFLPGTFILFKPRDIVSGDFYWFAKSGDKVAVAAVDCTGHGVPGAFMSLIGNELLNDIVVKKGVLDPAQVLMDLHQGLVVALKKNNQDSFTVDGMDISFYVYDPRFKTVDFASTGSPFVVIRDSEIIETKGGRFPIGLVLNRKVTYQTHRIQLQPNDTCYVFTDGYCDQFNPEGKKLRRDNFYRLLLEIENEQISAHEELLHQYLQNWQGGSRQIDDVLVIGMRVATVKQPPKRRIAEKKLVSV